ncbi:MAG: ArsR family transcriptional regulator [Promethearchaeota archaeon]
MSKKQEELTVSNDSNELIGILEAYESETRLNIIVLLLINQELSLGEIAFYLKKSKPTILRHIQILIDLGLVKVFNKDEVQRGNIKRNYYSLIRDKDDLFDREKFARLEAQSTRERILALYEYNQSIYLLLGRMTKFIDIFGKNLKFLADHQPNTVDLDWLLEKKMPEVNFRMFSDNQFKKFEKVFIKFLDEVEEIEKEDDDSEKPYMFLDLVFPIQYLIELERKIE